MITDLKYALRMLFKAPVFTIVAVLTLALGIGANSAIFSVVDAVLLRPLPFPQPERLIAVWSKVEHEAERETSSFPDYADIRDQSQTIESLTCYTEASAVLGTGPEARQLIGLAVTSDIFRVLGVQPYLGRAFTRAEDNDAARVVVLTYESWKRLFNGDAAIVGRDILLSLKPYTVIGVMPPGFRYPVGAPRDYLMPLHPLVPAQIKMRESHFLRCVGRLKPGVSVNQATAEVKAIADRVEKQYPSSNTGRSAFAISLHDDLVGDVRPALLTVLAAVFLVLLIACANVANLLLARATARRREIAIRTALGASRRQIVRQLLAEGFVLALLGSLAGLLLAWWGIDLLRAFGPHDVPRLDEIQINSSVIAFTLAAAIVSTLLFATFPALQVSRLDVNASLQEGARGAIGPGSHRLRAMLVIVQVALSILLLAGAGLLIKSFGNLSNTNPGFDPHRVMALRFSLPRAKYSDEDKQTQFLEELIAKLRALPGIESVGGAAPLPFSGNDRASSFWIVGRADPGPGNHPNASHLVVAGDYFRTMRIPLLAGRTLDGRDTKSSAPVIMVNETFARQFFPGKSAIGERIRLDRETVQPALEIVGLVGSTRHESLATPPIPEFYLPLAQSPSRNLDIVLRTSSDRLTGLDAAVRSAIGSLDPEVFVPRLEPLETLIGSTLGQPRFNMMLLGCFAGAAMVLATIGIYSVIAYIVAQRTREIGIRMALGAQRTQMLGMVLRQSMLLVVIGIAIGLLVALVATRVMGTLLYGVGANDIAVYATVIGLLGAAALLASYLPARRAMKVDPMVALRYE